MTDWIILVVIPLALGMVFSIYLQLLYCLWNTKSRDIRIYKRELQNKKSWLFFLAAICGMAFCQLAAMHYELSYIHCIRNMLVFVWLLVIALIDGRQQLIPRMFTTTGFVGWIVLLLIAVTAGGSSVRNVLFFSGSGLLLGGGVLLICRLLSKGGIGMGDIRMFSVIGLLYGMNYTFSILFFTILFMSVYGLAFTALQKKSLKSTIAMAPFTLAGFCVSCLLGV